MQGCSATINPITQDNAKLDAPSYLINFITRSTNYPLLKLHKTTQMEHQLSACRSNKTTPQSVEKQEVELLDFPSQKYRAAWHFKFLNDPTTKCVAILLSW